MELLIGDGEPRGETLLRQAEQDAPRADAFADMAIDVAEPVALPSLRHPDLLHLMPGHARLRVEMPPSVRIFLGYNRDR
jgi:hypothetical protein